MQAHFFEHQLQFREWLEAHHDTETEIIVGFYKVGSGKPSMTWSESVDQALCFGWIDGVRRSMDDERYCIRFTPRKPNSIWSVVNIKKVESLTNAGLMKPAGLHVFHIRKEEHTKGYSFERDTVEWSAEWLEHFQTHPSAWEFFNQQAPSYQKTIKHWIMSAKQEKTQRTRLEKTIAASAKKKRL